MRRQAYETDIQKLTHTHKHTPRGATADRGNVWVLVVMIRTLRHLQWPRDDFQKASRASCQQKTP